MPSLYFKVILRHQKKYCEQISLSMYSRNLSLGGARAWNSVGLSAIRISKETVGDCRKITSEGFMRVLCHIFSNLLFPVIQQLKTIPMTSVADYTSRKIMQYFRLHYLYSIPISSSFIS